MSGLGVATLQADSFVFSACSGRFTAQDEQLAVALHTSVQLWRADAEGQPEHVATVPFNDTLQSVLTISNATQLDWLMVLTLEQNCVLLEWDQEKRSWNTVTTVISVPKGSAPRRVGQVRWSSAVAHKEPSSHYVQWALAAFEGVIHVLRVNIQDGHPDMLNIRAYWTGSRHPEATMVQIEMISCMHSWDVVAVVLATASPAGTKLDLHSYELSNERPASENASTRLSVAAGPWLLKNVHPTSYLLFRANAQHCGVAGFVLVSNISITVLNPDWVDKHHSYRTQLTGLPTCSTELPEGRWLIGDTMGQLYVLHSQDWSIRPAMVEAHGPVVSPPTVMCHLGSWGGQPGMLFLGSQGANSQLLLLEPRLLQLAREPDAATDTAGQPHDLLMHDPAFLDSPAPVHAALLLQDPPGCGEQRLLMACGVAPAGSIRLASASLSLVPSIQGGPHIEGQPTMQAVHAHWGSQHHAYLAFSSTSTDSTLLMDVSGTHFQQLHLPGLITSQATVLLAASCQNVLVQVTAEAVHLVSTQAETGPHRGDALAKWVSRDGPCSTAALHGDSLAIGLVTSVQLLEVQQNGSSLQEQQQLQFLHQVSAVSLCQQASKPRGSLTLAMGLWEANEVQLLSLPDASLMHTVPLISSHARSIVTGRMGSTDMLFAGCSDGTVVYAPLPSATSAGHESAGDASSPQARRVHAGASGVALHWVPEQQDTAAHVYAQSDKGLVLRVAAGTDSSSADVELEAVRVHQAEGLVAITPVHTEEMPAAMAWLSQDHMLTFGHMDHSKHLHWQTHTIGDTPEHLANHAESGCCVCLSKDAAGMHWLRLYQAATLQEVVSVHLGEGHVHTALCMAALPCSSVRIAVARGRQPQQKQFIVVASYVEDHSTGMERLQGLLSFFEVCSSATAGSQHTSGVQLLHHGTEQIPAICHCLAAADDPSADLAGAEQFQLLLAGCHDAVRLYRVQIDDASERSTQAVAAAINRVAAGEHLQVVLNAASGPAEPAQEPASEPATKPAAKAAEQAKWGDSHTEAASHQTLPDSISSDRSSHPSVAQPQPASQISADNEGHADLQLELLQAVPGSRGTCVTSVAAHGATVLATEFLTSLTAFTLLTGPPWLLAVSADDGLVHAQSVHMLSSSSFLVGLHPQGLQLVQRDVMSEEAALERWQGHVSEASTSGVPAEAERAASSSPDMQALQTHASCTPPWGITAFCPGTLGICSFPPGPSTSGAQSDTPAGKRASAVFVANDGTVGVVALLAEHELGALAHVRRHLASTGFGTDLAQAPHWGASDRQRVPESSDDGVANARLGPACVDLDLLHASMLQAMQPHQHSSLSSAWDGDAASWILDSLRHELLP